ncbi:MAG: ankyrin repeat domain-containing protein [Myxococcales bacterium]|nr:ankyrin repeat domain-containing protein [Myxococcales bacterium]
MSEWLAFALVAGKEAQFFSARHERLSDVSFRTPSSTMNHILESVEEEELMDAGGGLLLDKDRSILLYFGGQGPSGKSWGTWRVEEVADVRGFKTYLSARGVKVPVPEWERASQATLFELIQGTTPYSKPVWYKELEKRAAEEDLAQRSSDGKTVLHHIAVVSGKQGLYRLAELAPLFISLGADPLAQDIHGNIPLDYALLCSFAYPAIQYLVHPISDQRRRGRLVHTFDMLLDLDPAARSRHAWSKEGFLRQVAERVDAGGLPSGELSDLMGAVVRAIECGRYSEYDWELFGILRALKRRGARGTELWNETRLWEVRYFLCPSTDVSAFNSLVEVCAGLHIETDTQLNKSRRALRAALKDVAIGELRALAERVTLNATDEMGDTALHKCTWLATADNGISEIAKLLVVRGANPKRANKDGVAPIQIAEGNARLVTILSTAKELPRPY